MKKFISLLLVLCFFTASPFTATAATEKSISDTINDTAAYLLDTVTNPAVGPVGGEWTIIGLARSGYPVPQSYYDSYYKGMENYVTSLNGLLHDKKYTEYARLILALTAIGKDPSNVNGYNLLVPLGDYDKTIWQGINGPIFALIALDSGGYDMPTCKDAKTQATRDMYIEAILSQQLADGGFSLAGAISDPDITAMVLQAFAKYQDRADIKKATDEALQTLSKMQDADGGYSSWNDKNCESVVQVIVALSELGITPSDSRFEKNGKNPVDNLLSFYEKGNSEKGSGVSLMATEQSLYALAAVQRVSAGKNSLYRMSDAVKGINNAPTDNEIPTALPGQNPDIQILPIISAGRTFSDIQNHENRTAIEALAARGMINGVTDSTFAPNATITRAEFATIATKALGLAPKANGTFADVPKSAWYAGFVGTANAYGIVNGVSANQFAPDKTITRQEAAVMVANLAKLCGLKTALTDAEIRDTLAQFGDYTLSAEWARQSLAFCYSNDILSQEMMDIEPFKPIHRSEVAEMLYQTLNIAGLLQ